MRPKLDVVPCCRPHSMISYSYGLLVNQVFSCSSNWFHVRQAEQLPHVFYNMLILCLRTGRISVASDSLFWYNTTDGKSFEYFLAGSSFTPAFPPTPSAEEVQQAAQYCTVDGKLNDACAYDYLTTRNTETANITAANSQQTSDMQETLSKPIYIKIGVVRGSFLDLYCL